MHSLGVNGEGELRGQPTNPGSLGKRPECACVCVCVLYRLEVEKLSQSPAELSATLTGASFREHFRTSLTITRR